MKIIYVHCREETNIRDPTAMNTTELLVDIRPEKKFFRPVQDLNHDLCDNGAAFYQLS